MPENAPVGARGVLKRVAISQSNYIPWKGYFDFINSVDEFVIFDDAQFTKRDWRNRNRLKGPAGACWLSIPIQVKGQFSQQINQARVADPDWAREHWATIEHLYARAPNYKPYRECFRDLYLGVQSDWLTEINMLFLRRICELLGIDTLFRDSREFSLAEGKTERLVEICRAVSATHYYCGPRSRNYLEEQRFQDAGIEVVYMDFSGYPEYPQLFGPFVHEVSIVDLIFNAGGEAARYMKTLGAQDDRRGPDAGRPQSPAGAREG